MLALPKRALTTAKSSTGHAARAPSSFDQGLMDGATRIFKRKEHVFFEGDAARHIYKLEAGHVCAYRLLADGRRQVLHFAFPGDFIGLGAGDKHTMNAQASEKTRLRCVATSRLREIVNKNPALGFELYEALAHELRASQELLLSVSHRNAQERIAGFLLALSQRNARRGENARTIVLAMSRLDIADFLGLTIETVSRTLSKLRSQEIIALEQCIVVTLKDPKRLKAIADGDVA